MSHYHPRGLVLVECPRCRATVPRGLGNCQQCGFPLAGPGVSMSYDKALEEGTRFAAKRMKEAEKQLAVNDKPGAKTLLADAYAVIARLSPTIETTAEFAAFYRDLGRGFAIVGDGTMAEKCTGIARILEPTVPSPADHVPDGAASVIPPGAEPSSATSRASSASSFSSDSLRSEIEAVKRERAQVDAIRKDLEKREAAARDREEALASRESRMRDEALRMESARREIEERKRDVDRKELELAAARRAPRDDGADRKE